MGIAHIGENMTNNMFTNKETRSDIVGIDVGDYGTTALMADGGLKFQYRKSWLRTSCGLLSATNDITVITPIIDIKDISNERH